LRRIWLVVAVMAVGVLTVGAAQAMAAKSKSKSKAPKTVITTVSCKVSLGTLSAPGETAVIPPAAQGSQYGPVHCGGAIGSGIQSDTFKLMDSGDVSVLQSVEHRTIPSIHCVCRPHQQDDGEDEPD